MSITSLVSKKVIHYCSSNYKGTVNIQGYFRFGVCRNGRGWSSNCNSFPTYNFYLQLVCKKFVLNRKLFVKSTYVFQISNYLLLYCDV